jgi:hypothetical protein
MASNSPRRFDSVRASAKGMFHMRVGALRDGCTSQKGHVLRDAALSSLSFFAAGTRVTLSPHDEGSAQLFAYLRVIQPRYHA